MIRPSCACSITRDCAFERYKIAISLREAPSAIKLEQNYRSHGHILDAANVLIANNTKRLGKNLRTDAGHGEQVRVYEASSDLQEAQWIIEEAKSLIAEGASRSEIAILYRSNAQSRVIEHALFSAAIPYHVYGGQRYFQRAEVKHAIAYLQLMDNPQMIRPSCAW